MGRVFLTIIVPLLLPTAFYLAWRVAAGRGLSLPASWLWLVVTGLALACLTLIAASLDFGVPRQGLYVPPHVSNGQVVPGHIEPGPAAPQSAR